MSDIIRKKITKLYSLTYSLFIPKGNYSPSTEFK